VRGSDDELAVMAISELTAILTAHDVAFADCVEKSDLVERIKSGVLANIHTK
jgi:hypothetical protein